MSKIVLLTGASGGFGELITKTLAEKGYSVYAGMRGITNKNHEKSESFKKWAAERKLNVFPIDLDVTSEDSIKKAISQIIKDRGRIDVLINNAGVGNYGITEEFSSEQIHELFNINVFGPLRVAKQVLPGMRDKKSGLIIQISSQLGRTVIPLMGLYSGTKFAVEAINESLAEEVADLGIDVCIVQPGGYPTDFTRNSIMSDGSLSEKYGERVKKSIAAMSGYMDFLKSENAPKPQEVADAILKLIEQKQRPRRVVVGHSIGAKEINELSEKVQDDLMKSFGIR